MREDVRAVSNVEIERNFMFVVDVPIEQLSVRRIGASDRVGLRDAATVLTQFHVYGIHKTGNCG